jgi:hypothetical protein
MRPMLNLVESVGWMCIGEMVDGVLVTERAGEPCEQKGSWFSTVKARARCRVRARA